MFGKKDVPKFTMLNEGEKSFDQVADIAEKMSHELFVQTEGRPAMMSAVLGMMQSAVTIQSALAIAKGDVGVAPGAISERLRKLLKDMGIDPGE